MCQFYPIIAQLCTILKSGYNIKPDNQLMKWENKLTGFNWQGIFKKLAVIRQLFDWIYSDGQLVGSCMQA